MVFYVFRLHLRLPLYQGIPFLSLHYAFCLLNLLNRGGCWRTGIDGQTATSRVQEYPLPVYLSLILKLSLRSQAPFLLLELTLFNTIATGFIQVLVY